VADQWTRRGRNKFHNRELQELHLDSDSGLERNSILLKHVRNLNLVIYFKMLLHIGKGEITATPFIVRNISHVLDCLEYIEREF
jgi:hypothetical protein